MPKQSFHANRFEGGMNTDFAPEDIPNNSLLDALGISVSNIGRITISGDPIAASGIPGSGSALTSTSFEAGYGLFSFNSDYSQGDVESSTKYLAMSKGSGVNIYDNTSNTWNTHASASFDLGAGQATHATENSYYAPNGDLRICDGKFNHANNHDNNVKWFGFTPKNLYGTGTGDAVVEGWSVQDASIEGGYPKDSSGISTNAFMTDNSTSAADDIYPYTSTDNSEDWGLSLSYVPASDSGTATSLADSTWQPNTSTEYKFYASYVYEGNQEGNPTPLKMYPSLAAYSNRTTAVTSQDTIRFMDKATADAPKYMKANGDGTDTTVTTYSDSGTTGVNHSLSNGDIVYIDGTTNYEGYHTVTDATSATGTFKFKHSYSGGDETGYVSRVGTNLAIYFTPSVKINGVETRNFCFGADSIDAVSGGNQRITGTRIYWSSSDEGHANLWLMMDCDFLKGVKAYGIGLDEPTVTDYIPWTNEDDAQDDLHPNWDSNIWKHPPKYETYESLNGYSHDSKLDAKWKTAVIANGRAYIGNVKRRQKATFNVNDTALASGKQEWNGSSDSEIVKDPTFGDRILKSPVDRFDTFPEEMAIELFGGDDGDSIVKLETFADRLFVFKKNTLHILNIAKDVEILESSHKGIGLDGGKPCQSCLTNNGIAWINSSGAYFYNGQGIESLTDNRIDSFWKGKVSSHEDQDTSVTPFWRAADVPSIGFDENSSKLILRKASIDGATHDDLLIYDMKIKAWTWQNESLNDELCSNFVNYDGSLIYHEGASTSAIRKYDDSPHPPSLSAGGAGVNLSIYTKPYDFGTPLQRKKIYKVYVTYRCSGTTNVQMQYYINGNTATKYNFKAGAKNHFNANDDNITIDGSIAEFDDTAGIWETASFKPATSSEANNVKSFGLYLFNDASAAVDKDFEINDITIIYRNKSVK